MNNTPAPILLFVYNRPWHTRQTLEALADNGLANQSRLIVFADGPKADVSTEQLEKIKEVRAVIRERKWCGEVEIIEREKNLGIETSMVDAITEMIQKYDKVIVLEDDIVTSQSFLTFMNEGLNTYENVTNVYGIGGYMYPVGAIEQEAALLPFSCMWGWATWKDKWAQYEPEMKYSKTITTNASLCSRFNLGDSEHTTLFFHPDKPWDIRWYYSIFVRNGLFLLPTISLVRNIGMDGSGTHYTKEAKIIEHPISNKTPLVKLKNDVNMEFYASVIRHFRKEKLSLAQRIINRTKRLINAG